MTFNRTVGLTALPTTNTGAATLAYLDPAQDILIALLKTAINNDLGPAWSSAALGTQLSGRNPVASTFPFSPDDKLLLEVKPQFPILCVDRARKQKKSFTRQYDAYDSTWEIDYILGPLTVEEKRKIGAAIHVVENIVQQICKVGGHPAYAMDGNSVQPAQVLTGNQSGNCGFSRFEWESAEAGNASFGEGSPMFWGTRIVCTSTEYGQITDATANSNAHVGLRHFYGTGTGVAADDGTGEDDNGIIEEQIERTDAVS